MGRHGRHLGWRPGDCVRAKTTSRRNIHWRRVVEKAGGFIAEVLIDFYQEPDALAFEQELIAEYGRSNFGGVLCNITAGGEGQCGVVMTPEWRAKIGAANRGRPKPEHVKAAVSAAQRGVPNPPEQGAAHSLRMRGAEHPFFGKKRPQHVIDALREKQSRPVIDRATGVKYSSLKEAAAAIGKSTTTISRWLTGARPNPTSLELA